MKRISHGKTEDNGPTTAALGKFKGFSPFKPESEQQVRKKEVKTDTAAEKIKKAWKGIKRHGAWDIHYAGCLERIKKIDYSAKDVEAFSLALSGSLEEKYFSENAGMFLSALINNCKESSFVIHTTHLGEIEHIGYKNTKEIVVRGDAGQYLGNSMICGTISVNGNTDGMCGNEMENGTIIVEGNASYGVGCLMVGGTLIVKKDTDHNVGQFMRGGSIIVEGFADENIGREMEGGEIHLNGTYGSIYHMIFGGRIFHKDERIFPK